MASNEWLVRKLHEQDKKIEALSRGGTGVGHTSIAPGENLTVISDNGEVVLGAGGVEHVDGPTPATPSAPTLKLGFGTIETTWDGTFAEGEDEDGVPLTAPVDFDVVEVHCSTDPEEEEWGEDTMRGQIKTREGGTITVGGFDVDDEVFVCLIALAKTGKRSAPSATASLVIEGLDFAQLTNELDAATVTIDNAREVLLDGQNTLGEKLDAADTALSGLETSLGELDSTTLPALRNDLDAAEGRLSTAEGQITDAFGQLDAVPGQISDARQEAIDAALAEIDSVEGDLVSSIDKKVNWSLDDPPAVFDGPADATWFKLSSFGSGGQVKSQWRWNGTVWVSTILSEAVLAKIDIGTGTFGEMDGIRLKAGSVYADRIVSGLSQNMVPDPGFSNSEINTSRLQRANTYGSTMSLTNGMLVVSAPDGVTRGPDFSLSANSDLYAWAAYPSMPVVAKAQARIVGAGSVCEFRYSIRFQLRDGTRKFVAMNPASYTSLTDEWVEVVGKYDLPQDAVGFSIVLQCRDNTVGTVEIRSPFVASSIGTTIIEPGAVTTDKLAANVLEVGNLKAGTAAIAEAVVAKIAAQTASIQQADIRNLFVTGTSKLNDVVAEQIAADTAEFIELEVGNLVAGEGTMDTATINKLFADVVVASMAQAQEFIGENAILTGAVTAPKITASEELWAKIAQFVKIRAEHIEADAIDGMVITGATIRSAATGARTLMSASGFEAYDNTGKRTFFASASTGNVSMTGELYTGEPGSERVVLDNSLWNSVEVTDPDTGTQKNVPGAGVRIGVSSSSGADIYHAAATATDGRYVDQAVVRGPLGRSKTVYGAVSSANGLPASNYVTSTAIDNSGKVAATMNATVGGGGSATRKVELVGYDANGNSRAAIRASGGNGRSNMWARDGNGVETSEISVDGPNRSAWIGGRDPSGALTAHVTTFGDTGRIGISGASANPLIVNYAGVSDWWLIPFRKDNIDWGYVGSTGAMGVNDFGLQAAASKNLVLTTTTGSAGIIAKTNGDVTFSDSKGVNFSNIPVSSGTGVNVTAGGWFQKNTSSLRYKTDVEPVDMSGFDVLSLEPKSFVYKDQKARFEKPRDEWGEYEEEIFANGLPASYGLIAEEVEAAGGEFVVNYDQEGLPDSLNYGLIGVALIPTVRDLRDRITELERQLNE